MVHFEWTLGIKVQCIEALSARAKWMNRYVCEVAFGFSDLEKALEAVGEFPGEIAVRNAEGKN